MDAKVYYTLVEQFRLLALYLYSYLETLNGRGRHLWMNLERGLAISKILDQFVINPKQLSVLLAPSYQ